MLTMLPLVGGCAATPGHGDADRTNYRTIQTDPTRNPEAARRFNDRGLEHLEAGDLDAAEKDFRKALAADVEFGPAHNNLGKVLYLKQDWYQAAWEFEFAAKLMPRRSEPANNLGLVLEQAAELDRAVEQYRLAVNRAPDNVVYQANLARALVKRGDRTREVKLLLEAILEADTRTDWLIWARQRLDAMAHLFP